MVTVLISAAFRGAAFIRGEPLIKGRRLFHYGRPKERPLLEWGAYPRSSVIGGNTVIDVYWMFSLVWQRHSMVKILRSKISILLTFLCYLESPASLNASFPLFNTPIFILNFIKSQLTTPQSGLRRLWANQI